jgi:serine/threonine-protein kinase
MTSRDSIADPPRSNGHGPSDRLVGGRYRLQHQLGAGATGTVYRAIDESSGTPVALKLLHQELLDHGHVVKRFRREGHRAPALTHPHLVALLDSGEDVGGAPFVVMELLEGRTLAQELRGDSDLPFDRMTHIVLQVLEAVGHAHGHGLLHRDLKPSNIMLVDREGDADFVKVCDFGLAKVFTSEGQPRGESTLTTGLGVLCGTPEYMSPEQARAEELDARSDLYAVGVMLYQLLCGQLPFRAASPMGVLTRQITETPLPPSHRRPDRAIPRRLEALVLAAMAKDPRQRPASAAAFAEELRSIQRVGWKRLTPATLAAHTAETLVSTILPNPRASGASVAPRARRGLAWGLGGAGLTAVVVVAIVLLRPSPPGGAGAAGTPSPAAPVAPAPASAPAAGATPAQAAAVPPATVTATATAAAGSADARRRKAAPRAGRPSAAPAAAAPVIAARPAPSEPEATLQQAETWLADGRVAESCALVERAAGRFGREPTLHRFLGKCLMRAGRTAEARAHYRTYLELSPDAPDAQFIREIVR